MVNSIKIYKTIKLNKRIGLYILLIMAICNASLRFTTNGMFSLFRLFSPAVALILLIKNFNKLKKSILILSLGILYSIVVSLLNYSIIKFEYIVFVLYIYVIYIIIFDIQIHTFNFEEKFWKFIHIVTVISLFLAFIQFFIRVPYPYVDLPAEHGINLFMSNENELGEPLGFISIIYLYKILFENKKKYIFHLFSIITILFINDAKLTILGCILGYCILLYFKFGRKIKLSAKICILVGIIIFTIGILFIYIINPMLVFRDYSISIQELLFSSIINIVTLTPISGSGGSIMDRTNAIIYGLRELINSKFLGIGWGNSVVMLSLNQYTLATAKSMHNIVIQFLCEMGIYAIFIYFMFFKWIIQNIKTLYHEQYNVLKLVFIISFLIISAQSSIGILSNYYTWIVIFYVAFLPKKYSNRNIVK